jgi:hypothetical protein
MRFVIFVVDRVSGSAALNRTQAMSRTSIASTQPSRYENSAVC